jgi:hypothetical protein
MNDYSTGSNPYAGPYFLARLLANLPVDEPSLNGIGSPWEGLGRQLVRVLPENRLNQFEAIMAKEPYHEAIRQAIFSMIHWAVSRFLPIWPRWIFHRCPAV